ncbi:hypothetical protein CONLIGDRAFT_634561, partial [Coniochaeta ligniaria NRRL 30616]
MRYLFNPEEEGIVTLVLEATLGAEQLSLEPTPKPEPQPISPCKCLFPCLLYGP